MLDLLGRGLSAWPMRYATGPTASSSHAVAPYAYLAQSDAQRTYTTNIIRTILTIIHSVLAGHIQRARLDLLDRLINVVMVMSGAGAVFDPHTICDEAPSTKALL